MPHWLDTYAAIMDRLAAHGHRRRSRPRIDADVLATRMQRLAAAIERNGHRLAPATAWWCARAFDDLMTTQRALDLAEHQREIALTRKSATFAKEGEDESAGGLTRKSMTAEPHVTYVRGSDDQWQAMCCANGICRPCTAAELSWLGYYSRPHLFEM